MLTSIRISVDTYNKLHFLKQPFETHNDALDRILSDYKEMQKKVAMLEDLIVKNG